MAVLRNRPSQSWIWSFEGVLFIVLLYGMVHAALRMGLSSNIGQDDVIGNLYVQTLDWGFNKRQPPLYDWLLWAIQQVTGPNLFSFLLLKYALWTATAGFIYLSAERVLQDSKWAALAVFSLSLSYQIGWNIHEGVTHTATLSCAVAATFWAFLRLLEKGRWADYLIFGLCIGFGLLSKYGFAAFLIMLFGAAILQEPIRNQLRLKGLALAIAIAVIILMPFALWLLEADKGLSAVSGSTMRHSGTTYLESLSKGLLPALYAPVVFLLPLLGVLPILFSRYVSELRKDWVDGVNAELQEPDLERLLLHMFLIGWALLISLVLFLSFTRILSRYMHPFALLFVIWLMVQAKRAAMQFELRRYVVLLLFAVLAVLLLRVANLVVADPFCRKCRQLVPYETLVQALREQGFTGKGIIVADNRYDGGNLRTLFPDAWVASTHNPTYVPPQKAVGKVPQIVLVWSRLSDNRQLTSFEQQLVAQYGGRFDLTVHMLETPWDHPWRAKGYRHSKWQYAVINTGS